MQANALGEQLFRAAQEAAAAALNQLAEKIYEESQIEVPKGTDEQQEKNRELYGETLQESGRYPGNMPELAAFPDKLEVLVGYEAPYALAQHEGYSINHSKNGKEYVWIVTSYTTDGTKSKFLEDPYKAALIELEPLVAAEFEARLTRISAEAQGLVLE